MGVFKNFELNAEQRQLAEQKHKQRLSLRAEYWKKISNPARHASGEGGHLVNSCSRFALIHNLHCYVIDNNTNIEFPKIIQNCSWNSLNLSDSPQYIHDFHSLIRPFIVIKPLVFHTPNTSNQRANHCTWAFATSFSQLHSSTNWCRKIVVNAKQNSEMVKSLTPIVNSNSFKAILIWSV